jgi:hypothetical protein
VIVLEFRMNPNDSRLVDPYAASARRAVPGRLTDIGFVVLRWIQCSAGKS